MTLLVGAAGLSMLDLAERRRELASLFSWAIPNARGSRGSRRARAAGRVRLRDGVLVGLLRARGVDVLAYDAAPPGRSSKNGYHRLRASPGRRSTGYLRSWPRAGIASARSCSAGRLTTTMGRATP